MKSWPGARSGSCRRRSRFAPRAMSIASRPAAPAQHLAAPASVCTISWMAPCKSVTRTEPSPAPPSANCHSPRKPKTKRPLMPASTPSSQASLSLITGPNRLPSKTVDNGGLCYSAMMGALRPPLPTATQSSKRGHSHFAQTGAFSLCVDRGPRWFHPPQGLMMCSSNMSVIRWILLQKNFCSTEHKFSAPWARRSKDVWGTASLCVKLTSDFGNVPEGIANSDYC